MRKIFPYILILIVLAGIFSPVISIYAQSLTSGACMDQRTNPPTATNSNQTNCLAPLYKWDPTATPPVMGVCYYINAGTYAKTPTTNSQCDGVSTQHQWLSNDQVAAGVQPNIGGNTTTFIAVPTTPTPTTPSAPPATQVYTLLAPLPCPTGMTTNCTKDANGNYILTTFDASNDATGSKLGVYLNLMIKIFIGICAVLAMIMIVIGGIEYMTSELVSGKEAGKSQITEAILGLLLALGAWALLNTINPNLLTSDIKIDKQEVTVDLGNDIPQTPVNGKYDGGLAAGAPWTGTPATFQSPSRVTVCSTSGQCGSSVECATVGQQNCTSIKGLVPSLVDSITSNCPNCNVVITGGTESWLHGAGTSHHPGSVTVDIKAGDTNLTDYIENGVQNPSDKLRWTTNGYSFFYEGNHWHAYQQ